MKTAFTLRRWGFMLAFLSSMLFYQQAGAQSTSAKCAGFTAKITNGSVLNLCTGSSLTLAASPVTAGYSYQWQSQTTSGSPFANISGATGTSYTTTSLGAYRVIVNTGGCIDTSGITSVVRIVVQGGSITAAQTTPICPNGIGGKITGTNVPGAELGFVTYQWEMNENNAGWTTVQGATDADYTAPQLNKTTQYRRVASDNCGNKAYSNVVTISIASAVNPGSILPATQTINRGQTPSLLTSGSPASGGTGSFTYQWQQSFWERGPFTNITGATGLTYQPGALQETFYYRRVATDVNCGNKEYTALAEVLVTNQILNAGDLAIPSQCFFPGQPASIVLTFNPPRGGVPPYTIQWQTSTNNSTWTDVPGANGTNYNPGYLNQTTWFRKKVTDANGTVAYTQSAVITMVTTTLTGGSIQGLTNVACLGSSPAQIKSTGSPTGYVGLIYQWQYKNASTGGAWTDIVGQQREALYPDPINEKTTYRRVAIDRCGSSVRTANSNEFEIDIRPAIIAGDIEPTSQMIRSGQTPKPLNSVSVPSGGTGTFSLSWEAASNAIGPWTTVPNVTTAGYQPGALTQTTYYRRAAMDMGCLATKYTYAVEVYLNTNPPVTGGDLAGSGCVFPGNRPTVITTGANPPANGTAPFTYQWESSPGTTNTWTVIPGETGESFQPPVLTQTMQYRRKITDNWGEFAYSTVFTVNLVTTPLNPGSIKTTTVVACNGGTPALISEVTPATGGGAFLGYQWQMKYDGGSWTDIAGANASTYQPGAITKRTYFRRAAMDKCGDAQRTAYSNEVVIELAMSTNFKAGLIDGPFITCAGTAPGQIKSVLDACAGNTTIKYQWERLNGTIWSAVVGAINPSYTPGAISANMTYRRKAYNDCGSVGYSNQVEIYVYPPIEPGAIGTETQTVCTNGTPQMIKLMTNCHYTDGTVTYQWQSSTSMTGPWTNIAGATTNQYQPSNNNINMYYRLMVMSTTCSMSAATNVASVMMDAGCRTAAPGTLSANDMQVFPNPVSGSTMQVKVTTTGRVNVTLRNAEGNALPVDVSNAGSGLMKLSAKSTLPAGMYLITVKDEKGTYSKKVIVQ